MLLISLRCAVVRHVSLCRLGTLVLVGALLASTSSAVAAQEGGSPVAGGSAVVFASPETAALLRELPGFEAAVLAPLAGGTPVSVLSDPVAAGDGSLWCQVATESGVGYLPAGTLTATTTAPLAEAAPVSAPSPEVAPTSDVATDLGGTQPVPTGDAVTTSDVNLRAGPSVDAPVMGVLSPSSPVIITGDASSGFAPVIANSVAGWIATEFLGAPGAPVSPAVPTDGPPPAPDTVTAPGLDPVAAPPLAGTGFGTAVTTDDVNLRGSPDSGDNVLQIVPAGTALEATGSLQTGFFPVSYGGQAGWVASEFLTFQGDLDASSPPPTLAAATEVPPLTAPAPEAEPAPVLIAPVGSGLAWPFRGGTWQVIQGYNNGTHTNRSSFANYQYSLDLARVDGDSAGQTVYAPASGTVAWVDGGSGGILIDMENGYGIAMFHITVGPGIRGGDQIGQGQPVGTVSGPGGPGYASTAHIDLTLWGLPGDGSHVSTPFTGQFTISGREFADSGGVNQHMGAEVSV